MTLLPIVLSSAVILTIAYFTYGRILARLLKLDPKAITPAVELRDNVDYEPIEPKFLLSQHFSAIAAAGPIVGPILAGLMFGWVPALIWILVGCIFIGGVHDITALVASIRHKARSIAEVVRDHMSQRSYVLFLSFVWIALVYIIVAFTDVTARSFVGAWDLNTGKSVAATDASSGTATSVAGVEVDSGGASANIITGGATATSSLLYLILPIVMGLLLRHTRLSLNWATIIFLPLVAVAIALGPMIPFELDQWLRASGITWFKDCDAAMATKAWGALLLLYCLIAAVVPVWLLLQPRGHLGGYFLYFALGGGALGLILGNATITYPEFRGWSLPRGDLFPLLFITIACGACSGFHSLIASGTTSKQLARETDARPIGYGAMLLEGMVAVVSLCCVMILVENDRISQADPNFIYAQGIGKFLAVMGIPAKVGISFALMAFTTFVYDTLDVCTRLGRYIIQELTGLQGRIGRWLGTGLTAGVPLLFLFRTVVDKDGAPIPAYKVFWFLFGASNQLLAALTLLGVTVWLWRTRREMWVWFVTGIPTLFMYTMSTWALAQMTLPKFFQDGAFQAPSEPVPWIGVVLLALAALMFVEAIIVLLGSRNDEPRQPKLAGSLAGS